MTALTPQQTSLEAFAALVRSGKIGKQQLLAWTVLQRSGPLTGRELESVTKVPGLWKRLPELRRRGLLRESDVRVCSITGKHAITWAVTANRLGEGQPTSPIDKDRKTRARRRFWITVGTADDHDAYRNVFNTAASARFYAGDDCEVIEVREVMRGN